MKRKVILISIDGMRPDGFLQCGSPMVQALREQSAYTLSAKAVWPSVTLPCHMSMFHSVPPERHGTTTNLYVPPVHPVTGLFEQVERFGGNCAMFYGWEPLRDIARPGSLNHASYLQSYTEEHTDAILTDRALACIRQYHPDFLFLYLVETDEKGGHDNGRMSAPYLSRIADALDCVRRVWEDAGEEYTIVITADHGGHDRSHGSDSPEDMTIPMFFIGPEFTPGELQKELSLLDLAPTITDLLGIPADRVWEGKSVLKDM